VKKVWGWVWKKFQRIAGLVLGWDSRNRGVGAALRIKYMGTGEVSDNS